MEYKLQNINVNELKEETLGNCTKDGWELISVVPKYETRMDYSSYSPIKYGEPLREITVLTNYCLILKKINNYY